MRNNWSNNQNYNWPQKENFWQNDNQNNNQKQQALEPMDVDSSINSRKNLITIGSRIITPVYKRKLMKYAFQETFVFR